LKDLGKKIRKYRTDKRLTIKGLAEVVSVSPSMISQIERGYASASLVTLDKIAKALEVPVSEFFEVTSKDGEKKKKIVRKEERKSIKFANSPVIYNLLTATFDSAIEFLLIETPPHTPTTKVTKFSHPGEEFFYVLKGPIILNVGDESFLLNEGDSGSFDSSIPHNLENNSDEKTLLLIAATEKFIT
jgi:transcriptional regulator with XRE-family HTH domain